METKNKLVIEYIDRIREEFLKRGHLIKEETYNKIVAMYKDSEKTLPEIKKEIDLLVTDKIENLRLAQEADRLKQVKIEDFQNEILTLKSIDNNGYPHIINTDIKIIGQKETSHNAPVNIKFGLKNGYFKNSASTSTSIFDKLEFVMCQIGKMFNVKMAETHKVYKNNVYLGIVSENVCDVNETFYTYNQATRFIDKNNSDVKIIVDELQRIRKNSEFIKETPIVQNDFDIKIIVDSFLYAVKALNISEESSRKIRQDYFKMIMFDFLVNNVDRNQNNYGLKISEYGDVSFAELFDNSTTGIPGMPKGYQQINSYLIEKNKLLNCLHTYYYDDIKDFSQQCVSNEEDIKNSIDYLCSNELSNQERKKFMSKFDNNMSMIVEKEKERQANNEIKENNAGILNESKVEEGPKLARTKPATTNNIITNNEGKINLIIILIGISLVLILTTLIILFKIS